MGNPYSNLLPMDKLLRQNLAILKNILTSARKKICLKRRGPDSLHADKIFIRPAPPQGLQVFGRGYGAPNLNHPFVAL